MIFPRGGTYQKQIEGAGEKKIKILFGVSISEIRTQETVFKIISSLSEDKYDITLVSSIDFKLVEWVEDLNTNRRVPIKIINFLPFKMGLRHKGKAKAVLQLYKIMKKGGYDAAHFHGYIANKLGRLAAWFSGIPKIYVTVYKWHINDEMPFLKRKILGFIEGVASRMCTRLIFQSDYDRDMGVRNKWVKENRAFIIHNYIKIFKSYRGRVRKNLDIPYNTILMGAVIKKSEMEVFPFLLEVIKELKHRRYGFKFLIMCDISIMERYEDILEGAEIDSHIIIVKEQEKLRNLMTDFDIFVAFQKHVDIPDIIMDAMSAGIPVVANRFDGVSEFIADGVNGCVVDGFDKIQSVGCIEALMTDYRMRERMGVESKKKVYRDFSEEKMVQQYASLYESGDKIKSGSLKREENGIGCFLFKRAGKNNLKDMSPSLRVNFSWVLSGNVSYALSKGLLMILIAKLGTPKMVGQFSLALAIAAPVFTLASLRLRSIIATDTKNEYSFSYYIRLRLLTSAIAILATVFIVMICGYNGEFALAVILIAVGKGIESISDIIFGQFENKEKMSIIGKSMMVKSVLSVICMGAAFKMTGNLAGGAAGLAVAWLTVLLSYDFVKVQPFIQLKSNFNFQRLIKLFRLCIPLSIVTALGAIEGNISTYLVQGHLGSEALGYYSAIANLIVIGDTIINSLGSATTPRLAKYYAGGDKKNYIKTLARLIVVSSGLGAMGLVLTASFGRLLLSLLYDPSYGEYWSIFLLLMIASCLRYMASCLNNSLTAARKLKIQPIINTVVIASIIIFSSILVPMRGIEGMAYAAIMSSYMDFLGNLLFNVFTL